MRARNSERESVDTMIRLILTRLTAKSNSLSADVRKTQAGVLAGLLRTRMGLQTADLDPLHTSKRRMRSDKTGNPLVGKISVVAEGAAETTIISVPDAPLLPSVVAPIPVATGMYALRNPPALATLSAAPTTPLLETTDTPDVWHVDLSPLDSAKTLQGVSWALSPLRELAAERLPASQAVAHSGMPLTRIGRPPGDRFNAVVLGSSPAEAYPESAGVLTGKLIYTVYLRVGLRKNWVMQYCLPLDVEQAVQARGQAGALEAPWPFLIVRPDMTIGPDLDYLMVHGHLTSSGHFDQLSYVLSDESAERSILLSALEEWEFRPAIRNGQAVAVEVLLIIPRQS